MACEEPLTPLEDGPVGDKCSPSVDCRPPPCDAFLLGKPCVFLLLGEGGCVWEGATGPLVKRIIGQVPPAVKLQMSAAASPNSSESALEILALSIAIRRQHSALRPRQQADASAASVI